MKKKWLSVGIALAAASLWSMDYRNPALNPVHFEKAPDHAPLKLVVNGKLQFVIACDRETEKKVSPGRRSVTAAAEALADGFERTTGSRPAIVDASSPEAEKAGLVLAVGRSVITDKLGVDPNRLPKEGFLVRTHPGGLVIAGADGSMIPGSYHPLDTAKYRLNGTMNGAYDFLERVLGMRFYYPGIGVVAPRITDLTLTPVSYRDEPRYYNRNNYAYQLEFRGGKKWPWPDVRNDSAVFNQCWRLTMATRCDNACHSPRPDFMHMTYPDKTETIFFRDSSGKLYYNPAHHVGNFFNLNNPDFTRLLMESYRKFYAGGGKSDGPWKQKGRSWYPPNSEYVIFGQSDTRVSLKTAENSHLFPEERKNSRSGSDSDYYAWFHSNLAREIGKAFPGRRLIVLAYHHYALPPLKYRDIPENLDVQVCIGRIVLSKNPGYKTWLKEVYSGWYKALGNRPVTAWTYGAQRNAFTQAIQGRYMKDFLQAVGPYLSRNALMYDAGGLKWHFYYSYYPVYRLLWNPDFNTDAALDEHWEKLYGPEAGSELKAFYRLLVERWEKVYLARCSRQNIPVDVDPALLYQAYDLPAIRKLEGHLSAALKATAPGSIERRRVDFFAEPWKKEFTAAKTFSALVLPVAKVRRLMPGETIHIDGKTDEGAWNRAHAIPLRDALGGQKKNTSQEKLRLLWDSSGIYIGFRSIGKPAVKPGDLWFKSDHAEIFFAPSRDKNQYYQFAISPEGMFHSASKVEKPVEGPLDSSWKCSGIRYQAYRDGDAGWSFEMFIPFRGLKNEKAPSPYETWFMNFVYTRPGSGASSFSLTMGNNHYHELWGKIKFMGKGD